MSPEYIFKRLYPINCKSITLYAFDLADCLMHEEIDYIILIKMSVIYLIRMHKFNELNIFSYITYSMIVASKYLMDEYYDLIDLVCMVNKVRVSHNLHRLNIKDIMQGELHILSKLDWDAYIEPIDIKELDSLIINKRDVGDGDERDNYINYNNRINRINRSNFTCVVH